MRHPAQSPARPQMGMRRVFLLSLNIRQKVIVVMTVALLTVGAIASVSYRYVVDIEKKNHLAEVADDLSNIVLEIRRYEKNLLLYGSEADLEENQAYSDQAKKILQRLSAILSGSPTDNMVFRLKDGLDRYASEITQIAECLRTKSGGCHEKEEEIRQLGKSLVDMTHELAAVERANILRIIAALKSLLLYSLLVFPVLGGFMLILTSRKIVRPLKIIEGATLQIANGNFELVEAPPGAKDESSRVLEAFNRMIGELENHQDQLLEARKLSSIGIMAAGIAHQLNNPLNNISTSNQILLEEFPDADTGFVVRMLESCEHEVERAKEIVRGLLEFSRAREFSIRPSSLSRMVSRALRLASGQVPSGIRIESHVEDLIFPMDGEEMQEVLINLIINAAQAIGEAKGCIRISGAEIPGADMVEICVEDTGSGIRQEDFDKIFDPFFSTKAPGVGTGLGLSIAYGIVKQHQGVIMASNRPEGGASISIRLPMVQKQEGPA